MKILSFADDYISKPQDLINAVSSLDFAIPAEIFSGLDFLTHYVGYFMPLRLYKPIIILILGYWFILICIVSYRAACSFFSNLFSFVSTFKK